MNGRIRGRGCKSARGGKRAAPVSKYPVQLHIRSVGQRPLLAHSGLQKLILHYLQNL